MITLGNTMPPHDSSGPLVRRTQDRPLACPPDGEPLILGCLLEARSYYRYKQGERIPANRARIQTWAKNEFDEGQPCAANSTAL